MFGKKPLTLYRNPDLYLEQVQGKGRGVFCLKDIKKDDLIEVAPLIIFPNRENKSVGETLLMHYVFNAAKLPKQFLSLIGIEDPEQAISLPMGITSLCNHMVEANAHYTLQVEDMGAYALLSATRDIKKGEEISVSYGETWFLRRMIK